MQNQFFSLAALIVNGRIWQTNLSLVSFAKAPDQIKKKTNKREKMLCEWKSIEPLLKSLFAHQTLFIDNFCNSNTSFSIVCAIIMGIK